MLTLTCDTHTIFQLATEWPRLDQLIFRIPTPGRASHQCPDRNDGRLYAVYRLITKGYSKNLPLSWSHSPWIAPDWLWKPPAPPIYHLSLYNDRFNLLFETFMCNLWKNVIWLKCKVYLTTLNIKSEKHWVHAKYVYFITLAYSKHFWR